VVTVTSGQSLGQRFENGEQLFCIPHFTKDALLSFCANPMTQCAPNSKVAPWCVVGAEKFDWQVRHGATHAPNRP
jgi:hypothetical protein